MHLNSTAYINEIDPVANSWYTLSKPGKRFNKKDQTKVDFFLKFSTQDSGNALNSLENRTLPFFYFMRFLMA